MKINKEGLELIKRFEGLRLEAYYCPAGVLTIGYGHTGKDVKEDMIITEEIAEQLLLKDIEKAESYVNDIVESTYHSMSINQFSALVSFTYNCGKGNLTKLTNKNKRSLSEIAVKMLEYNKANGKELAGLKIRRQEEQKLFLSTSTGKPVLALPTLKLGVVGLQVQYLQQDLNYLINADLVIDGHFGRCTESAVKLLQSASGLIADGIYGKQTYKQVKDLLLRG